MCGKFTQMATWRDVVDFSQPLAKPAEPAEGGGAPDEEIVATPMRTANILRLNAEGERELVPMRWGFAKRTARSPFELGHMHARSETVDALPTFAESFALRRGILPVRTFNEGEEVGTKTKQWVITPRDEKPIAIAVIYEEWVNGDERLLAFVQVTTPANSLISRITDRMPAILRSEDHALWLGEDRAPLSEVKALLQTYDDEGNWEMTEQDKVRPKKPPRANRPPKDKPEPDAQDSFL